MIVTRSAEMGSLTTFSQRSISARQSESIAVVASIVDHQHGRDDHTVYSTLDGTLLSFEIRLTVQSNTFGSLWGSRLGSCTAHVQYTFSEQYVFFFVCADFFLHCFTHPQQRLWVKLGGGGG